MKTAIVCGAGGFIGSHLVKRLKSEGYWVRGVDIKKPEFSPSAADEFLLLDLREAENCRAAVALGSRVADEVYQLAAATSGVKRYFYSSSVCVYRDMKPGEPEMREAEAVPAKPDNEYGWEKLYSERMAQAYSRKHGMVVRIARFQNCYGPEGTWQGGREKAPAAICRKVAAVADGGTIEIWGDGSAVRSYTYVDDMVDGIYRLMHSDLDGAVNIGCPQYVTVRQLVEVVAEVAGKRVLIKSIPGPVGVQSRNFSNERIYSIGWRSQFDLKEGIRRTYPWVNAQVEATNGAPKP